MTIDIPSDYEDILRQAVASGAYANPEAALRHALELFAAEQVSGEQPKRDRWNERNRLSIEQSSQGLSKPLNDETVVDRLQARLADRETRH